MCVCVCVFAYVCVCTYVQRYGEIFLVTVYMYVCVHVTTCNWCTCVLHVDSTVNVPVYTLHV